MFCADLASFMIFVETAKPLEMFNYCSVTSIGDSKLVEIIGARVYEIATEGKVYLVRKRSKDEPYLFNYYAIKASKPPVKNLIPLMAKKEVQERMPTRRRHKSNPGATLNG